MYTEYHTVYQVNDKSSISEFLNYVKYWNEDARDGGQNANEDDAEIAHQTEVVPGKKHFIFGVIYCQMEVVPGKKLFIFLVIYCHIEVSPGKNISYSVSFIVIWK